MTHISALSFLADKNRDYPQPGATSGDCFPTWCTKTHKNPLQTSPTLYFSLCGALYSFLLWWFCLQSLVALASSNSKFFFPNSASPPDLVQLPSSRAMLWKIQEVGWGSRNAHFRVSLLSRIRFLLKTISCISPSFLIAWEGSVNLFPYSIIARRGI